MKGLTSHGQQQPQQQQQQDRKKDRRNKTTDCRKVLNTLLGKRVRLDLVFNTSTHKSGTTRHRHGQVPV